MLETSEGRSSQWIKEGVLCSGLRDGGGGTARTDLLVWEDILRVYGPFTDFCVNGVKVPLKN